MKKYAIFFLLFAAACTPFGSGPSATNPTASPNQTIAGAPVATPPGNRRLELDTFKIQTPTPTPVPVPSSTDACNHDAGQPMGPGCDCQEYIITCQNHQCTNVSMPADPSSPHIAPSQANCSVGGNGGIGAWCNDPPLTGEGNGTYCVGKPVIYLYPMKPTLVNVSVKTPGSIVVSDPNYGTGWQNVLANPDGVLTYHNKTYRELFYETSITTFTKPTDGIVIPANALQPTLTIVTHQLGLTDTEQQEFLQYWLPKLQALKSRYILFSILTPQAKEAIDHVTISPKPTTQIQFLAYFKPLAAAEAVTPLQLPKSVPKRIGFTSVEWGGTIDQ